jgi:hypothetical protein
MLHSFLSKKDARKEEVVVVVVQVVGDTLPSLLDSGAHRGRRHASALPVTDVRRQGPP